MLSFVSVAVWWVVFSIPMFRRVPEPKAAGLPAGYRGSELFPIRAALDRLVDTGRALGRYRQAVILLVAFLIYNDGIGTIMRMATIYAEELKFTCDSPGKDPFLALPELSDGFKLEKYLAQIRNQLFLQALEACNGNQTAAAKMLGVSKQTVSKFVLAQNDNES